MANRDLFSGVDYQREIGGEKNGSRLMSSLVLQGLVALLLFCGISYLYDMEGELGDGVRYVVALAKSEQQEALAVSGLGDFFAAVRDGQGDEQDDEQNNDNKLPTVTSGDNVTSGGDYEPGEEYLANTPLSATGEPVLILPISGLMQSAFGELGADGIAVSGLEIFCQQQQSVKAAAIGEVVELEEGKRIVLKHSGGLETAYVGEIAAKVKKGDIMQQGEALGEMSEGVLLFQVLLEGEAEDPLKYVLGPE